jgi:hypothetical protein
MDFLETAKTHRIFIKTTAPLPDLPVGIETEFFDGYIYFHPNGRNGQIVPYSYSCVNRNPEFFSVRTEPKQLCKGCEKNMEGAMGHNCKSCVIMATPVSFV